MEATSEALLFHKDFAKDIGVSKIISKHMDAPEILRIPLTEEYLATEPIVDASFMGNMVLAKNLLPEMLRYNLQLNQTRECSYH